MKKHLMMAKITKTVFTSILFWIVLILSTSSSTLFVAEARVSFRDSATGSTTLHSFPGPGTGNDMLQFNTGGHILGFKPDKVYLAGLDHALAVKFLGTPGVTPEVFSREAAKSQTTKAAPMKSVVYKNLWQGITLRYEAAKNGITESTYHISPGADVANIRLRYNVPVEALRDGSLKLTFANGYLTESRPVAWQDIEGKRVPVTAAFKVSGQEIGFRMGPYDRLYPLTIDPTYAWHTFHGSSNTDYGTGIAVDGSGNIYVTGLSHASWGSPLHAFSGGMDIFVLKLNSSGEYQWHTFYGSDNAENAGGIAVDGNGNVYVVGSSYDWGAPLHANGGSLDAFILKLNGDGQYQWHTFYGSSHLDTGYKIAVDSGGNLYVAGYSFQTWGAPLHDHSGTLFFDMFVMKLNNSGEYQWHTFYGSNVDDNVRDIILDGSGCVYLTGSSDGTWGRRFKVIPAVRIFLF